VAYLYSELTLNKNIALLHLLPKAFAAARQAAGWELIRP
jgi:hypothetical protein